MIRSLVVQWVMAAMLVAATRPYALSEEAPELASLPPGVATEHACLKDGPDYRLDDVHHDIGTGVARDRVTLRWNDYDHPVDAYSAFLRKGGPQSFCMRYELHNAGTAEIPGAWWVDIARFGTLHPAGEPYGTRSYVYRPVFSDPAPETTTTDLEAFRRATAHAEAYLPKVSRFVSPEGAPRRRAALPLERFDASTLEREFGHAIAYALVERPDRAADSFLGVVLPSEPFDAVSIERAMRIGDVVFAAYSTLSRREDGVLEVESGIDLRGHSGSVSAPYLSAASTVAEARVSDAPIDLTEAVVHARETVDKLPSPGEGLVERDAGRWVAYTQTFSADIPVMALVEHPVAISTEAGGVECFLAPSYAPIPVSFSLAECPEEMQR